MIWLCFFSCHPHDTHSFTFIRTTAVTHHTHCLIGDPPGWSRSVRVLRITGLCLPYEETNIDFELARYLSISRTCQYRCRLYRSTSCDALSARAGLDISGTVTGAQVLQVWARNIFVEPIYRTGIWIHTMSNPRSRIHFQISRRGRDRVLKVLEETQRMVLTNIDIQQRPTGDGGKRELLKVRP